MRLVSLVFALLAAAPTIWAADASLAALEDIKLANNALTRKQNDRALALAKKALAVLEANPAKPEGLTQADWDKRRNLAVGDAHLIAGVVESGSNQFFAANKDLRAALPLLKENKEATNETLFYLGVANYQVGRQTLNKSQILEGAKYSEQCVQSPGPYQERAYNNAKAMRQEAAAMR